MMTLLERQTSVIPIPVDFIRSDSRPWPIRIRQAQKRHRQILLARRRRKPHGGKINPAEECLL
jgi:hypothetical protein